MLEHPGRQRCPLEEQPVARLRFTERLLGATEADERAHGGDEHGRLHGLGQIAVGAAVQAAHGVAAVHEGGRRPAGTRVEAVAGSSLMRRQIS